jgi:FKBP-type peptidyl-prolyl cis-trans isomerase FkpA
LLRDISQPGCDINHPTFVRKFTITYNELMRNGTKVALFTSLFVLFTLGVIGVGVWRVNRKPATQRLAPLAASPVPANPAGALNVTGNAGLGGGTETMTQEQNGAPSSQTSKSAQTVPGPESFGQYEKYKDDKSALFMDLKAGDGAELVAGKKAAVLYKVWLTNGTLVDQSQTDKASGKLQALAFTLGDHSLIPGWEQGVFGMKVNGLRRMIIPPIVGYGAAGKEPVPPNAVLIIDVQLLQVE